jgi:hypothetical protein
MSGVTISPLTIADGFSTASAHSIQLGEYSFPLKADFQFGFPHYDEKNEYFYFYNLDYYAFTTNGRYFEPGLVIYSTDINNQNSVYFIRLYGYFAHYEYTLIINPSWRYGPQGATFKGQSKIIGLLIIFGRLFTYSNRLKGSFFMNLGGASRLDNPCTTG